MRLFFLFFIIASLFACNNPATPDVSKIKIKLNVERFEEDFFNIDTTKAEAEIQNLQKKYPTFANIFLFKILNADPAWNADTANQYVLQFKKVYHPLFDSSEKIFKNFSEYSEQVAKSLKYVKYYFPEYHTPEKIITYIGPLDGYGDILGQNEIIVGLHHHLGSNFSLYKSSFLNETYPEYISRRFTPEFIPINAMKNIISDMFPQSYEDQSLIVQMVEEGKKLYLLQKFVPYAKEYNLIGYTESQLKESYGHEKVIWSLFTQNNLLQVKDINIVKNYIGESPRTIELGEAAPGNIGSFAGWQIVKKYVSENKNISPAELMQTSAEKIYNAARYKP